MTAPTIRKHVITVALASLGVRPGDLLGMHSRVPALGRVVVEIARQGREAARRAVHDVIDAALDAVGPGGLLMVPTFGYCFVGRSESPPWNRRTTPSFTGWLTDELWRRPDACRSDHPTHAVACIGADADRILADHERRTPLGLDSPFHRLAGRGGWICCFGTTGTTLSLLHVAEVVAGVPYANVFNWAHRGWQSAARIERPDGSVAVVPIDQCPGCSENFGKFDLEAEGAGLFRVTKVYDARVVLFRAQDALDLAVARIRRDPGFFLCERGKCPACDVRWRTL